jgi:hypothetical protein
VAEQLLSSPGRSSMELVYCTSQPETISINSENGQGRLWFVAHSVNPLLDSHSTILRKLTPDQSSCPASLRFNFNIILLNISMSDLTLNYFNRQLSRILAFPGCSIRAINLTLPDLI